MDSPDLRLRASDDDRAEWIHEILPLNIAESNHVASVTEIRSGENNACTSVDLACDIAIPYRRILPLESTNHEQRTYCCPSKSSAIAAARNEVRRKLKVPHAG